MSDKQRIRFIQFCAYANFTMEDGQVELTGYDEEYGHFTVIGEDVRDAIDKALELDLDEGD